MVILLAMMGSRESGPDRESLAVFVARAAMIDARLKI
jgi:hypothetical protein